jgi:Xaa-Pro aminopeptidase
MKALAHRLIETRWPEFAAATEPAIAPVEEFQSRIERLRAQMEDLRLSHLVVYGDREHFANLAYLTNFDPRFEEALLVIGPESRPLLIVGNECEAYLPISPLFKKGSLRTERFQPFSLLDQPRDRSRSLGDIFRSEKITAGARVGCVGWKYYGDLHQMDVPSYIIDALRSIVGFENVTDATQLLVHPGEGLRSNCSASEIAYFEYSNLKASEAMKRIHFALRCGMTDRELVQAAHYDGTPLACHLTLKTGPSRISLASPNGSRIEKGHTWSANISFWGSNICRAGWIAEEAEDLPLVAREYVSAFAGPYFEAMAEWLSELRIDQLGGALYRVIQERLPFEKFGIFLNPGHLIHLDEWVSSPIYEGSDIRIRSGMVIQTDVIPSSSVFFSTRMEDGVAIADGALRDELRRRFPECYQRCQERRRFVQETLGLALPEEVLPLSNMACIVPPYLLRPERILALQC